MAAVNRSASRAILAAYRAGGFLAAPFVSAFLAFRTARGKEDRARLGERRGAASLPRPAGRLVWVHAASVGETNAVLPLVARLTAAGLPVVFTSGTRTSADVAAARLPPGAVHQFGPLDVTPWVDRFLAHWRPVLAIFVESELWPGVIGALAGRSVPLVVVNARMSDRSFRSWRRVGIAARAIFPGISLCLAQSDEDAARFTALGAPNVRVSGNLKFDTPPLAADADRLAALQVAIGGRPVWVAASTHDGEEAVVADAHRRLAAAFPGLLTVIVPRHPERGSAIRAMLDGLGLAVAQRSRGEQIAPPTAVYLADTLGELGLFYRLSRIAFLGGSLTGQGGHNPIEPARLGAVVLHGPDVHNFADLFALIDRACPGPPVTDAASLAAAVGELMANPGAVATRSTATVAALEPLSGALDRTVAALGPYLTGKPA